MLPHCDWSRHLGDWTDYIYDYSQHGRSLLCKLQSRYHKLLALTSVLAGYVSPSNGLVQYLPADLVLDLIYNPPAEGQASRCARSVHGRLQLY